MALAKPSSLITCEHLTREIGFHWLSGRLPPSSYSAEIPHHTRPHSKIQPLKGGDVLLLLFSLLRVIFIFNYVYVCKCECRYLRAPEEGVRISPELEFRAVKSYPTGVLGTEPSALQKQGALNL